MGEKSGSNHRNDKDSRRFRMTDGLSVTRERAKDGSLASVFVKNVKTGKTLRLGEKEYFLLERFNGQRTSADLQEAFWAQYRLHVRTETIDAFAATMARAGLLEEVEADGSIPLTGIVESEDDVDEAEAEDATAGFAGNRFGRAGFGGSGGFGRGHQGRDGGGGQAGAGGFAGFGGASSGGNEGAAPNWRGWQAGGAGPAGGAGAGAWNAFAANGPGFGWQRAQFAGQGAFAGGAARFGAAAAPEPPPRVASTLHLFNPGGFFAVLSALFGWTRWFLWLTLPAALFAALTVFHRLGELLSDIGGAERSVPVLALFALSLLCISALARIAAGVAAQRAGAPPKSFGLIFVFWIVPRFYVDLAGVRRLDRTRRLGVYKAPLLMRLWLFAGGTIIWAVNRQSGTLVPDVALLLGQMSLLSFLVTAMPFLPNDGYSWLSAYLDKPMLRERAFAYAFSSRRPAQPPTAAEQWLYVIYLLGCALMLGLALVFAFGYAATALAEAYRGLGVLLFFGVMGLILSWFVAVRLSIARLRRDAAASFHASAGAAGALVMAPGPGFAPPAEHRGTDDDPHEYHSQGWLTPILGLAAVIGLIYVAFLPYNYEVGGDFLILPDKRLEVHATVAGEIVEVAVREGEQVEPGQLVGRLSDWNIRRNIAVAVADLDKARAQLATLEAGPKPEEIALAREVVGSAEAAVRYQESEFARAEQLSQKGTIPGAEYDRMRRAFDDAKHALLEAEAQLALASAGARSSEIEAARAEVAGLEEQLSFQRDQLDRTEIRTEVPGRVVSENVDLLLGKYLEVGDLFMEIEDHATAQAEVLVSETDIGLVKVGDMVRLKAWAYSEAERNGIVTEIAPLAQPADFGHVIRVTTAIDNDDGAFRPSMTGFAKIGAAEMPVWRAFSRMIDRFVRIELWSWLP